jgi:hypothetical protein
MRYVGYKHRFSQVDTDIRYGSDGVSVMTRVDERKRTFNFYWDTSRREIDVYVRGVWSDEEVDVDQAAEWIDGDVSTADWQELTTKLLPTLQEVADRVEAVSTSASARNLSVAAARL